MVVNSLEQPFNASRIPDESNRRLEPRRRDVTLSRVKAVGDPFHKVLRILLPDGLHLVIDLSHTNLSTENGGNL